MCIHTFTSGKNAYKAHFVIHTRAHARIPEQKVQIIMFNFLIAICQHTHTHTHRTILWPEKPAAAVSLSDDDNGNINDKQSPGNIFIFA